MLAPLLPEDGEVLAATPARTWDELRRARLLITGSTGFVGTWLLAGLVTTGLFVLTDEATDLEPTALRCPQDGHPSHGLLQLAP